MSLIPLFFRQLPASRREEIGEAKNAVSNSYPLHWLRLDSRFSARHHTPSFATCFLVGWSDRHGFRGNEVASLQTASVHYPRPNCASRHVQPLCSQQFRLAPG